MPQDDDDADRAFLRDEETVRLEFRAASHAVWLELATLLGQQWESARLGHLAAGRLVQRLGDLAKLRCFPDGRPLPASAAFECLVADLSRYGKSPLSVVERCVMRGLAGERRTGRSPAEIAGLIEAFLRCFAADYERGEAVWVDELYAMVCSGGPDAHWTIDLPRLLPSGDDGALTLSIPRAALEAAGLQPGDRLIVEPRSQGLWIGRAPSVDRLP